MEKRSRTIQVPISIRNENKSFTIDLPGNTKSVKAIIVTTRLKAQKMAVNRHYFGAASEPGVFDNSFIQSLQNEQMENLVKVFSITASPGQYIFYARPERIDGEPSFELNGIEIGVLSYQVVSVTDPDTGFTENYKLYQSVDDSLGSVKLMVG